MINRILRMFPYVKQLEKERTEALAGKISIVDLHIKDGKMDATFKTEFAKLLCAWAVETLGDAINYTEITLEVNDPPYEKYTVTIKRCLGKTPHQLRRLAEQELAELKDMIAQKII